MGMEELVENTIKGIGTTSDIKQLDELRKKVKEDKRLDRPTKGYLYGEIVGRRNSILESQGIKPYLRYRK